MAAYESWKVYVGFNRNPNDRTAPMTDITALVDGAVIITEGRQSARDEVEAAQVEFNLQNDDQRFTPGNPFSPYAPYVLAGRRCLVTDTVGEQEFVLFDGFISFPDAQDWAKSDTTAPRAQTILVTGTDWRLDTADSFLSTLGEYILANAGPSLKAYYPMGETVARFEDHSGNNRAPIVPYFGGNVFAAPGTTSVSPAVSEPIPGDDLAAVVYETPHALNLGVEQSGQYMSARVDFAENAIPIGTNEVCTAVIWVRPDLTAWGDEKCPLNIVTWEDGVVTGSAVQIFHNDMTGESLPTPWIGSAIEGNLSGFTLGGNVDDQVWTPLAVRFGYDSVFIELWYRSSTYTDTLSVTSTTTRSIATIYCPDFKFAGSVAHLQLYIGAAGDFTHDDFLAQVEAGWQGLARQRADERITTLAQYAGLTADDLELDTAAAILPRAELAGQKPGPLIREAAAADTGLVFTRNGRIVFHGRQRRYSPLLAGTVDLTWLEQPYERRTDPPVNVMDVTSSSGVVGHAVNTESTSEWTENAGSTALNTACDADPGNLAAFTVREQGRPRHRAPTLAFELRSTTDATRRALIVGAELSDRFALSGLPDNAPEGSNTFHIEGIKRTISWVGHRVEWNTGSVFGDVPGVVQPYPLVGQAVVAEETRIPF